jgi:hypothetical protein
MCASQRFLPRLFGSALTILSPVWLLLSFPPSIFAQTSTNGQWSSVMNWPAIGIHGHVLPTGKVMFWDSSDNARSWDPATGTITALAHAGQNIFCSGHSFLTDGRLFLAGGHVTSFVGLPYSFVYNGSTNVWAQQSNMNAARWYPTNTTLPSGDVLVVSGQIDTTQGMNPLPQVWLKATNTWRSLTTAQLQMPFYPYMYVVPDGRVFVAGPDRTARYLDSSGTGTLTTVGQNNFGVRNWGSSVMYDTGKVMIVGGATCPDYGSCGVLPTKTAEVIDLNSPNPSWRYTASAMTYARKHHNATLLPDGTVLVTGGTQGTESSAENSTNPAYAAEVWDPAAETWTKLASNTVYRGYHSTALLLPDGRVLSAGGDFGGASAEVFSPPYLFKGARPTVTSVPASVNYGQTFPVQTPNATSITKVNLVSLSSVTHTFNENQRLNRLSFSQTTGGLNVTAPANANLCPPGYYMLFLINSNGVPSVAKFIQVFGNPSGSPPDAPTNLTATGVSGTQINLSWNETSTNVTGFKIERSTTSTGGFVQIATTPSNVLTYSDTGVASSTTYYYRVRATNNTLDSPYSNIASATAIASPTMSISPTSGSARTQSFQITYTNSTVSGLQGINLLMNTAVNGLNACWIYYDHVYHTWSLSSDDTSTWSYLGVGAGGQLSNTQCTLNGSTSSVSTTSTSVQLTISLTLNPSFAGTKTDYLRVWDPTNAPDLGSYAAAGTFTVLP